MPSMTIPSQATEFTLESGLKIQSFRKDPSKFFADMEAWMKNLNVGSIEKMAITGDGAGYLTLVIAYREKADTIKDKELFNETVGLMCDLSDSVHEITNAAQSLAEYVHSLTSVPKPPANELSIAGDPSPAS